MDIYSHVNSATGIIPKDVFSLFRWPAVSDSITAGVGRLHRDA